MVSAAELMGNAKGRAQSFSQFPKIFVMPSFYAVKFKSSLQLVLGLPSIFIWSLPENQVGCFVSLFVNSQYGVLNVFRIALVHAAIMTSYWSNFCVEMIC